MTKASSSFSCDAPPAAVLATLSDIDFLAASIPGVVKVEKLDERTALWTVHARVGFLERTSVFRGEIVHSSDHDVQFRATGAEATVDGQLDVARLGADRSQVSISLDLRGEGPLGPIVEAVMGRRLSSDVQDLGRKVQERVRLSRADASNSVRSGAAGAQR